MAFVSSLCGTCTASAPWVGHRVCRTTTSTTSRVGVAIKGRKARLPDRSNRVAVRMADGGPPINAPSSVLLLTSSVLAISSIGCVFELSGGHPTYGSQLTCVILAGSLPGFLFFFYAAIRKGQQEALDDPVE